MSGALIIGAGGHGKVAADILLCSDVPITGFLDDNAALWGTQVMGLPVLGGSHSYGDYQPAALVPGVGNNTIRQRIAQELGPDADPLWLTVIHPHAVVARSATIGAGTLVAAGSVINPDTVVGRFAIVNTGATVDHDCTIGDFVHIAPGAHLAGGVRVGAFTLVGVGASVIPYCAIGSGVTVGAGAAVVTDIPDSVVAKGVPARW
jgi:sugar O-acyltransferase (sialic acid O-acetyltransferase NeuD family)